MEEDKKREEVINKVKNFFKSETVDEGSSKELEKKREDLIKTIKEKKEWFTYIFLGIIIWFGSWMRLQNLNMLKDVTTGKYIPLALDPHLFLKYAKYIVEHGSLYAHDATRFVPEGISTVKYVFMSSFIAYLYKIMHFFNPSVTVEYADVVYPVICFAVAMFFFFLLVRRLFEVKVAILSTLFLTIVPAFLHRTMAGFSDHEALGVMLMFMAMYFYVVGWQQKETKKSVLFGALAGLFTGLMGLTWGGWKFLLLIIGGFTLVEFFFAKIKNKDVYQYSAWVVAFVIPITLWIPMFNIKELLSSFTTSVAFLVLFVLLVDLFLFKKDIFKFKQKIKGKVPVSVASFVISVVLGLILITASIGSTALVEKVDEISDNLLHPLGNDRWELTVAEQHQPYFTTWVGQFGPNWFNLPLYLTLFMVGSIILFYNMVGRNKIKIKLTAVYVLFLLAFTMSRHSPNSLFNGVNTISKTVYLGSLAAFILLGVYFYFSSYYNNKEEYNKIRSWDKKYIFVLIWFLIMVVAARGASRLMFIFAPITALMASYAVVNIAEMIYKLKNKTLVIVLGVILLLVLVNPFTIPGHGVINSFSKATMNQAKYSGPGYNQQWQMTGKWARENLPEDAVFGHWWDYGYWVQSGFERATVLDGTNKNRFWNYLMGRNGLTAQSQNEALEFLKAHKTTHFLIVAAEIGKYTAYSSIGSNEDYDRYSWITTFSLNEGATQETRNMTMMTYQGSYVLDDDFVYEGKAFPAKGSGIGAIFVPMKQIKDENGALTNMEFGQPHVALMNKGQRTDVPLECIYFNGQMQKFSQPGLKGCLRMIPTLQDNGQLKNIMGAGLYVSEEGMNALWPNLYLFEQNNPAYDTSAFKMVYGDDGTYAPISLHRGRVIGPQKIWEINYPAGFTLDPEKEAYYNGPNSNLPDYFYDVN